MEFDTVPSLAFCHRHHAVSFLFANDPQLFEFMFDADHRHLCALPSALVRESWFLPLEERVLAVLALCIWTERGHWPVHEAYLYLSDYRYEGLQLALEYLGNVAPGLCACSYCRHASVCAGMLDISQ